MSGAKRIKAIAFRGSRGAAVTNPDEFARLSRNNINILQDSCSDEYNLAGIFSRFGTGASMGLVQSRGVLATQNSRYGNFEKAGDISGQFHEKIFYLRAISCHDSPVRCGRSHKFHAQDGGKSWARWPEYETMYSLGSRL